MNTLKNLNFLQKSVCPSFTQLLIKFSQMNFLRVEKLSRSSTLALFYNSISKIYIYYYKTRRTRFQVKTSESKTEIHIQCSTFLKMHTIMHDTHAYLCALLNTGTYAVQHYKM